MSLLFYLLFLVEIGLGWYLLLPLFLLLYHYLMGRHGRHGSPAAIQGKEDFHFVAIVTAYKNTRLVAPLVDSLLKQTYPHLKIMVVADDCPPCDWNFPAGRVELFQPVPALHSKIKSINLAVDHFAASDQVLVIFDADNLVHPRFFENINLFFKRGFLAVQSHMLSKNTGTVYANLDSIGHVYYTFLERQSRMEWGLSSCILGLGIAIEKNLYLQIRFKESLEGFDKRLQALLVKSIPQIGFCSQAIVFDEKVETGPVLEKQRTRWLYTYFQYLSTHLRLLLSGIHRLNLKIIYFALIQLRPPLFLLLGISLVFTLVNFYLFSWLGWLSLAIVLQFMLSFILIVSTQSRQKEVKRALWYLPLMLFWQVTAFFKLRKASKQYLVTQHDKLVYIDHIIENNDVTV